MHLPLRILQSSLALALAAMPLLSASSAPRQEYDPAVFAKPMPAAQLAFLSACDGAAPKPLEHDKKFRKLVGAVSPNGLFHLGVDMPIENALELVLEGATAPVRLRDGRYLMVSTDAGVRRGFLWVDVQEGIGIGGIYFHPSNGEPTPTLTLFSRQAAEAQNLDPAQLPAAFRSDLEQWERAARVPPVLARYFITSASRKILLLHSEEFCTDPDAGTPAGCAQLDAAAADMDLETADYLDQTRHATNATARMVPGAAMQAWIQDRDHSCLAAPNLLDCRIRMTRERVRVVVHAPPRAPHRGH